MNKLIPLFFLVFSIEISGDEENRLEFKNDAYPSNSPISNDLKREVYELVKEGNSAEQIKSHLVQRYGNFIIYNPPIEPATYILWFGPFLLILLAIFIILFVRKR